MDLWERGLHPGLAGYAEAEGAAREVRDIRLGDEEDKQKSLRYYSTVLLGNRRQVVRQSNDR